MTTHENPSASAVGTDTSTPDVIVFDVNETLSNMSPMRGRFEAVGLAGHLAPTWFASLLRDGFALTVTRANPAFAQLAEESLHGLLDGLSDDVDAAVAQVMSGFTQLPVHDDVVDGIRALQALGLRLVTLSNGSAAVAEGLLERNELRDAFEALLSVQDAPAWKPAAVAYQYALDTCQVPADAAMLVAVHPWDIHGAHEAGLRTAWINRTGSRYPATMHLPDLQADSLTELAQQLSGAPSVGQTAPRTAAQDRDHRQLSR